MQYELRNGVRACHTHSWLAVQKQALTHSERSDRLCSLAPHPPQAALTTLQLFRHPGIAEFPSSFSTQNISFIFKNISPKISNLHLSGLTVTASHPVVQKIRIIRFFFEYRLHWQFEVRLLLFTVRTCVYTFRPRLICSPRSNNTVLCLIR